MALWLGYPRVSRVGDRAERLISPELQERRILDYAGARGLTVEMLEPELDQSGGKADRPILERAIARIERGDAAGVIVAQIDRLSRMELADALKTIQRIESTGGEVIAVAENFDAGTPEGRMARSMFLSVAHMQLERSRIGFATAKARAVRNGIWPAPKAPIGYTVTARKHGGDGKLYRDPETAPKVVKAFEMAAGGQSWITISRYLDVGISTAQKICRNRAYLGEINLGDLRETGTHEPLVSPDLFAVAQVLRGRPPRRQHDPALLAGLVRCAGCQRTMGADMTIGDRIYRCGNRAARSRCPEPAIISQKKLDAYITDLALAHFGEGQAAAARRGDDVDDAMRSLNVAEAELEAYQEVTRVSAVGPQVFERGMRRRVEDVESARAALGRARQRVGPLPGMGDARELWEVLSVEERRHLLRGALGVIWVKKGRGPCTDRVRVIAPGAVPAGLSQMGRHVPLSPIAWERDLEGEIRVARGKDLL